MLNYDKPSRIFPCILLTRNHMIFLVQFGINKHLLIFSKTTNCTRPTGSCNFVSLWKNLLVLIYSKLHLKSCDYLYKADCFSQNRTGLSSITIIYIDKFLLLTGRQCWTIPIMSSRNESVIHSLAYTGCFKTFSTTSCVRYWSWIILNSMYIKMWRPQTDTFTHFVLLGTPV